MRESFPPNLLLSFIIALFIYMYHRCPNVPFVSIIYIKLQHVALFYSIFLNEQLCEVTFRFFLFNLFIYKDYTWCIPLENGCRETCMNCHIV